MAVTRAVVEEIIDNAHVKVRMPFYDGFAGLTNSTPIEDLNIASVATSFGIYPNIQVGDEVFVTSEDKEIENPVVIGKICNDNGATEESIYSDAKLLHLVVQGKATLPNGTSIGNVTSENLGYLENLRDNAQFQLDTLAKSTDDLHNSTNRIQADVKNLYDTLHLGVPDCMVTDFEGTYDGDYHTCKCTTKSCLGFLYSEDGTTFQDTPISYKNPGHYTIYIKAFSANDSKIVVGHINIIADNLITVRWGNTNLIANGLAQTPSYSIEGVVEGDDVEVGTLKYYDNNNQELITGAPKNPGLYKVIITQLKGDDASKYHLDDNTAVCFYKIDEVISDVWGSISNIISEFDGEPKSIVITEAMT